MAMKSNHKKIARVEYPENAPIPEDFISGKATIETDAAMKKVIAQHKKEKEKLSKKTVVAD
jgi:hypothetical protein